MKRMKRMLALVLTGVMLASSMAYAAPADETETVAAEETMSELGLDENTDLDTNLSDQSQVSDSGNVEDAQSQTSDSEEDVLENDEDLVQDVTEQEPVTDESTDESEKEQDESAVQEPEKVEEAEEIEDSLTQETEVSTFSVSVASLKTEKETINVQISGVENQTEGELPLGNVNEEAPKIDGYDFVNATVNGTEIVSVDKLNGAAYYSIDGKSAVLLGSNEIVLNYTKHREIVNITYQFDATMGVVEGPESKLQGETVWFTVSPERGYAVSSIKVNDQEITVSPDQAKVFSEYSFEVDETQTENIIVNVEFQSAVYHVEYEELEGTDPAFGYTINKTTSVDAGKTLEFSMKIPGTVASLRYLVINGKTIELPTGSFTNDSKKFPLDGNMELAVEIEYIPFDNWEHYHAYTIQISNVYEDLKIGYYINWNSVEVYTLQFESLENVEVYYWNKNSTQPKLEQVNVGDKYNIWWLGRQYYFYVKTLPGYEVELFGGEGSSIISKISSDANGGSEAKDKGCQYVFYYTSHAGQENHRTVSLKAKLSDYKVIYNDSNIVDDSTYHINDRITISGETPQKTGYVFQGWKVGENKFKPSEKFVLDETILELINENNEIVLEPVWVTVEEAETAKFQVKYYYQSKDTEEYELKETIEASGNVSDTAVALPKGKEGYALSSRSNQSGEIEVTPMLVLEMYYGFDSNGDGTVDTEEQKYKITYDYNDDRGTFRTVSDVLKYTEQRVITDTPSRSGYTFRGWLITNQDVKVENGYFKMPDHDVTFKAQWESNDDGGGNGGTPETPDTTNPPVTPPTTPVTPPAPAVQTPAPVAVQTTAQNVPVEEEDEYTLSEVDEEETVAIEEDETPLGNMTMDDSEEEKAEPHCILHYIILLITAIVAAIFVADGEKRRKRIKELQNGSEGRR